jgi:hypothetical protein
VATGRRIQKAIRAAKPARNDRRGKTIDAPPSRTSQILREILTKNPNARTFTIKQIVEAIGEGQPAISLMFFSIPGMLPVPGTSDLSGIPAGLIAGQMIAGKTEVKLPQFILLRSVPRRSLAVAIHAVVPFIELAEKVTKPRHQWAADPVAQRVLGVVILILALVIAVPVLGFNLPHAASIFMISLGLVQQDGLAILLGVAAGLISLALFSGMSIAALRLGTRGFAAKLIKKIGLKWFARTGLKWAAQLVGRLGFHSTAPLLADWSELLLLWDPETARRRVKSLSRGNNASDNTRKTPAVRQSQKLERPSRRQPHLPPAERPPTIERAANAAH